MGNSAPRYLPTTHLPAIPSPADFDCLPEPLHDDTGCPFDTQARICAPANLELDHATAPSLRWSSRLLLRSAALLVVVRAFDGEKSKNATAFLT